MRYHRLTPLRIATLLACSLVITTRADEGEATIGVVSSVILPAQAKGDLPSWAGKAFRPGVVTAANPYGAEAGAAILEQGGNAIDAAVAIAYALNVVEQQSAGVGGGGFMMIHLAASGRTFAIDTRNKTPAGATRDMSVGVPQASLQGVAAGVPGMVRGTAMALEKCGNLSLG
jgi:gamma-glutamyltranspeptidase/glutathione hydrolase